MTKESNFNKLALNIEKRLEAEGISSQLEKITDQDQFQEIVARFIQQMMDADFERFLSVMYRMDVSEARLKKAMHTPNPQEVYIQIARLIIEREEQKIYWREKYKDQ